MILMADRNTSRRVELAVQLAVLLWMFLLLFLDNITLAFEQAQLNVVPVDQDKYRSGSC